MDDLKIILKNIFFKVYKILFSFLGKWIPKNKNIIIFESFLGKQFSDNPRAIYEYLKKYYSTYTLIWSVDREAVHKFQKMDIKFARRFSLKWLFLMNRSKYWVSNSRMPLWIPKPQNTIYLQTWHGTPLKKLANDMEQVLMPGTDTASYKQNFLYEAKKWDYLISANPYSTNIFKSAFQFNKEILETGYPRNDYLINCNTAEEIKEIKNKSHLPHDKKIILYAPTWRDNEFYGKGRYKFDIPMDLTRMKKELSSDYIILLRMHYLIAENIDLTGLEDFVYDFSDYEDIRELYLISDVLITDYSSVFFDYAILKRPIYFYTYDLDEYRDSLRGFYLDFENEVPGPIIKTTEELLSHIKKIEKYNYEPIEQFYHRFCKLEDGQASKRVAESIFSKY